MQSHRFAYCLSSFLQLKNVPEVQHRTCQLIFCLCRNHLQNAGKFASHASLLLKTNAFVSRLSCKQANCRPTFAPLDCAYSHRLVGCVGSSGCSTPTVHRHRKSLRASNLHGDLFLLFKKTTCPLIRAQSLFAVLELLRDYPLALADKKSTLNSCIRTVLEDKATDANQTAYLLKYRKLVGAARVTVSRFGGKLASFDDCDQLSDISDQGQLTDLPDPGDHNSDHDLTEAADLPLPASTEAHAAARRPARRTHSAPGTSFVSIVPSASNLEYKGCPKRPGRTSRPLTFDTLAKHTRLYV